MNFPSKLMFLIVLILFGLFQLLVSIGALMGLGGYTSYGSIPMPSAGLILFALGLILSILTTIPLFLASYTFYLADLAEGVKSSLMRFSWVFPLIGFFLYIIALLITALGGSNIAALTSLTGLLTSAQVFFILVTIGVFLALFFPALGKMVARKEIGLGGFGLVVEIISMIFSFIYLLTFILMFASAGIATAFFMFYGIIGIVWAVLQSIAIWLYHTPGKTVKKEPSAF